MRPQLLRLNHTLVDPLRRSRGLHLRRGRRGDHAESRAISVLNHITGVSSVLVDARGNLTTYGGLTLTYDPLCRVVGAVGEWVGGRIRRGEGRG
jgi:hypothetical protein